MLKINEIRTEFRACHSITVEINEFVKKSGVRDGILTVSLPDTTTGLAITSFWDKLGLDDMLDEIDRNFPTLTDYKMQESPYDSSGHVKSSVFKNTVNILISNGELMLGSSQGLVIMDFDGPQTRKYVLKATSFKKVKAETIPVETVYMGMHDITKELSELVKESGVQYGLLHAAVMHSTAGLISSTDNIDNLRNVMSDIEDMIPTRVDFKHRETASDAGGHVKTALTGTQISIPILKGQLVLEDESILFAEFDGPRPRKVVVGVLEREEI